MKSPFKFKQDPQPFLAPLGSRSHLPRLSRETLGKLPPSAAPIAVTLVGGLALIVLLATFLGREAGINDEEPAPLAAEEVTTEQPEMTATATEMPGGADQSPVAEVTAPAAVPSIDSASQLLEPATFANGNVFEPDPDRTSSIPPAKPGISAFVPSVAVAESEDEIAKLEAIQRREVEDDVGTPSEEETASIGPIGTPPMQHATTTRYVNMRAGPADEAEVLLVVPALVEIEAEAGCDWCTVRYDGRTGYIYKTFLSYE